GYPSTDRSRAEVLPHPSRRDSIQRRTTTRREKLSPARSEETPMPTMMPAQVTKPGGDFELVERPIPEPDRGQVRIKVDACGICHSDGLVKDGLWPGLPYPRIPGHEISGRVDAVGKDVTTWKPGQRVGVGWHGGHCFVCDPCQRGDFILCRVGKVTALSF